jgi:hypothetical protein
MNNQNIMKWCNILLILSIGLGLVSCSSAIVTEEIEAPPETNIIEPDADSEDPPSQADNQADEAESLGGYGMGPIGFDPLEEVILTYDGDPILLSYYFEETGSDTEVGMMFFLDGVAQPYQIIETSRPEETSATNQEVYLSKFQLNSTLRIEYTVAITPVTGSVGDEISLYPVVLFEPSFLPETEEGHFGIYHNANFYLPVTLRMDTDAPQQTGDYLVDVDLAPIPEKNIGNASLISSRHDNKPLFTLYAGDSLSYGEPRLTTENVMITLHLSGFGGIEATYRVTVFVNHQPVPIDGHENFLIETHDDQVSTYSFPLDIQAYDRMNGLYAIIVPVGDGDMNQGYYYQKTSSILLINDLVESLASVGD